jgi:hypothetical protein
VALAELLQHLVNGLSLGAVYAMIALGYTMVYGVLQLINFAHAEVFMLGAFGGYYAARWLPPFDPWPRSFVVLALAMIACAAVGFAIERIAYRPLRGGPRLNALITAIGVSMFLQAVAQLPWFMGPSPHFFPPILPHATFVFPPGADVASFAMEGVPAPAPAPKVRHWWGGYRVHACAALPPRGVEVEIAVRGDGPIVVHVVDESPGLPPPDGERLRAARPPAATPSQQGDATYVSARVTL